MTASKVGNLTSDEFSRLLTASAPHLKRFAMSLCADPAQSDDLVQETLLKAWASRDRFQPATNLNSWLFTILRNSWISEYRKTKRYVADPDSVIADAQGIAPVQDQAVRLNDALTIIHSLSPKLRTALTNVLKHEGSFALAAAESGCSVNTFKSRVARARQAVRDSYY